MTAQPNMVALGDGERSPQGMLLSERCFPVPFHGSSTLLKPSGEITIRRVSPMDGVTDTFTFKDEAEMREALGESHSLDDLHLFFHELAKSGSAIFHAGRMDQG